MAGAVLAAGPVLVAKETEAIALPPPRSKGGLPLFEALALRRSTRAYSDRPLPAQVLSDLLWAAFGVNRPSGDRTAPYWRHIMVIDVYAATADGVWLYEPKTHSLLLQFRADIRTSTGLQDFVGTAPLNLIYVAHGERMQDISPQERRLYAFRWIPASSVRTSICSAPPKDLRRSSAALLTTRSSTKSCNSVKINSLRSRRPSVTRGAPRGPSKPLLIGAALPTKG